MALTRRSVQRMSGSIWPGFVDAMTALLLVLMFVLTIFMIVQFMLRETISGQETELDKLTAEVTALAEALGLEQQRSFQLEGQVESQQVLIANLTSRNAEQADQIAAQSAQITSFEAQVASLLAERDAARSEGQALAARLEDVEAANAQLISEQEALQIALAQARDEIDAQAAAARLAAARREALDALIADLKSKSADQEASLAQLAAQLDDARAGNDAWQVERDKLNEDLSAAEAARLAELAAADALRAKLSDTEAALSDEEKARLAEAAAAARLREELQGAKDELTAMTLALEAQRKKAEDTLTLLAAAQSAEDDLNAKLSAALAETEALKAEYSGDDQELRRQLAAALAAKRAAEEQASQRLSEAEERAILLATANRELDAAEAASAESQRQVALLNEQVAALRAQLGSLQGLLDEAEARDRDAKIEITNLGTRLNAALARVASEERQRAALEEAERKRLEAEAQKLERYKSEFFGQMREVLADREGVRIVGDRFVFSSEVLFEPASATLSASGKDQIARVATLLNEVSDAIPPQIDWVIRVDGHTDKTPLSGNGRFADNWELSQARALSVVRYMTEELGFPPERLAATGFGEFQPIDPGDSPEALARNRRIELKLTER